MTADPERAIEGNLSGSSTLYDDLGVSRSATPDQIKVAYITWVKRVHPDTGYCGDVAPSVDVRQINAAYFILKDPDKRRAYDRELELGQRQQVVLRGRPRAHVGRRAALKLLLFAAVLGVGANLLLPGELQSSASRGISSSAEGLFSSAEHLAGSDSVDATKVVISPELRRAAHLAMASTTSEALTGSVRCYARARQQSGPRSADPCIVFDVAFEYWHQNETPRPLHPYFEGQNVEQRSLEALGAFGATAAEEHLDAVRAVTFSLLLEQIRALSAFEDEQRKALDVDGTQRAATMPPKAS